MRGICGENVLNGQMDGREVRNDDEMPSDSPIGRQVLGDLLIVKPIHDKLLYPLQRVIKLRLCGVFPNLAFSHLLCYEL